VSSKTQLRPFPITGMLIPWLPMTVQGHNPANIGLLCNYCRFQAAANNRRYKPWKVRFFVVTVAKPREIVAAHLRDRVYIPPQPRINNLDQISVSISAKPVKLRRFHPESRFDESCALLDHVHGNRYKFVLHGKWVL
jgi:hypothetical protein